MGQVANHKEIQNDAHHGHGSEGHHKHGHVDTTPLGIFDVVLGGVAFYGVTEGLYLLCGKLVPGLLSQSALIDIQLSGALFLVVWIFLGNLVFKPFIELAEKREASTSGAEQQAAANTKEFKELEERIAQGLQEARIRGVEERDRRIQDAKRRAQQALEQAQQLNGGEVKAAQSEILRLKTKALTEIDQESKKLAGLVIDRTLAETNSKTIH